MTEQLQLAPRPIPAQRHSATSVEAAEAIEPKVGTLRRAVLQFIRQRGSDGATDEEIQLALNWNPSTQRPRRVELCNLGLVRDSGRTRLTKAGRKAVVWIATGGGL
jgi:hypothetical protein